MSHLTSKVYGGTGERARESHHYSQTIRVPAGDVLHVAGQVGMARDSGSIPHDFGPQVDLAFENVEHALKQNEGSQGWHDVYRIRVYIKSPIDLAPGSKREAHLLRNMRKYMPSHQPVMTLLGVVELAHPLMLLEIEVEAHARAA